MAHCHQAASWLLSVTTHNTSLVIGLLNKARPLLSLISSMCFLVAGLTGLYGQGLMGSTMAV